MMPQNRVFAKVNTVLGGGIYHICVGASVLQVHADTYTNTYTHIMPVQACTQTHTRTRTHTRAHTYTLTHTHTPTVS